MKKLVLVTMFILLSWVPTMAGSQQPEILTGEQQSEMINKVQRYLDGLKRSTAGRDRREAVTRRRTNLRLVSRERRVSYEILVRIKVEQNSFPQSGVRSWDHPSIL